MKHKNMILALISCLVLVTNAEASNKKAFKVLFTIVPTAEAELVNQAKSYIGRELRALQDVEVLAKTPAWIIFLFLFVPSR